MKASKLSAILIVCALSFTSAAALAVDVKTKLTLNIGSSSGADDEAYTIEVPKEVAIQNSGWNELGSITVKYSGTSAFNASKKVVVTVTSTHNTEKGYFYLSSDTTPDAVEYYVTTSKDAAPTTTFEFTSAEITPEGTSKAIGVYVTEDYSGKDAGDYEDEITYTAQVEAITAPAASTLLTLTVTDPHNTGIGSRTFYYAEGETWGQAISNHSAENAGWHLDYSDDVYYSNDVYDFVYIELSVNSGSYQFIDATDAIDSTASYCFMGEESE